MSNVQTSNSGLMRGYRYETTADGDVVTYGEDGRGGDHEHLAKRSSDGRERSHSRNLSAHFFDATKLTGPDDDDVQAQIRQHFGPKTSSGMQGAAPSVGQKHRRMFSGDVSNPPLAHRRINSIGQASSVDRYLQRPRSHRREDSAGLDILSAAADVTGDELASAAGAGGNSGSAPWEPPPGTHNRLSSLDFFDYGNTNSRPPPPMKPSSRGYPPHHHTPSFGQYSQPTMYPPTSYYPPQPGPQVSQYPVQYSQQPSQSTYGGGSTDRNSPSGEEKINSDERLFDRKGSYGFPPTNTSDSDSMNAHHRKNMSSFSSIGALLGSSIFSPSQQDSNDHPLTSHHRSASSSISFLNGLDVLEGSDVNFLRNLHSSAPGYGGSQQNHQMTTAPSQQEQQPQVSFSSGIPQTVSENEEIGDEDESKLAAGGTSKRVRRKCTVAGCANRVVQGGLCISHGAKRKTCRHPGCTKNVKKAGLCSTHGPARKRCDAEGCSKVAVQGGRCIAHGAKKKLCSVENCKKQAILSGMCKKHHDKLGGINSPPGQGGVCVVIGNNSENARPGTHKSRHTRGLSIFQDLSADAVQNLLGEDPLNL